jgi:hypothetical protein
MAGCDGPFPPNVPATPKAPQVTRPPTVPPRPLPKLTPKQREKCVRDAKRAGFTPGFIKKSCD